MGTKRPSWSPADGAMDIGAGPNAEGSPSTDANDSNARKAVFGSADGLGAPALVIAESECR